MNVHGDITSEPTAETTSRWCLARVMSPYRGSVCRERA